MHAGVVVVTVASHRHRERGCLAAGDRTGAEPVPVEVVEPRLLREPFVDEPITVVVEPVAGLEAPGSDGIRGVVAVAVLDDVPGGLLGRAGDRRTLTVSPPIAVPVLEPDLVGLPLAGVGLGPARGEPEGQDHGSSSMVSSNDRASVK